MKRDYLKHVIQQDIAVLHSAGIMDYSLLIGLLRSPSETAHSNEHNDLNSNYAYRFGIIDYLQQYTIKKRVENSIKGIANPQEDISAVDESRYA